MIDIKFLRENPEVVKENIKGSEVGSGGRGDRTGC